jgi:PLP dependent protein
MQQPQDAFAPDTDGAASERLALVQAAIARAAADARRDVGDVTLIAVSKTHDAAAIRPLIAARQRHFGENRVQEAAGKWPQLRDETPDLTLHMVGQLQSNKAEDAVRLFDVIHSLDRPSLVTALARAMDRTGRRIPCFIQLDLAGEPQKGGCVPAGVAALLAQARGADIPVAGLMTVPPAALEPAPWFALLAKLADDHVLTGLSMGMSGDYPTAVRIGATHIRVGTALFGRRG